jgi:hypothetical protein
LQFIVREIPKVVEIDPDFVRSKIKPVIPQPIVLDYLPIGRIAGCYLVLQTVQVSGLIKANLQIFLVNPPAIACYARPGKFRQILEGFPGVFI